MPFHPLEPKKYESKVFTHYPSFISGEVCDKIVENKDLNFNFHPRGEDHRRGTQVSTADIHTPTEDYGSYIREIYKELCPDDKEIGWINLSVYREGIRLLEHTDVRSTLTVVSTLTDGYEGGRFYIDGQTLSLSKGDCLVFDGSRIKHGVEEIKSGIRISLNLWMTPKTMTMI